MGTQAKEEKKNWPLDKDVIRLSDCLSVSLLVLEIPLIHKTATDNKTSHPSVGRDLRASQSEWAGIKIITCKSQASNQ